MEQRSAFFCAAAWCFLLGLIVVGQSEALYVDDAQTLRIAAKLQSRVSLRMQGSEGFTSPDVGVGNMAQWRNLALLEAEHDMKQLTDDLDILYPLKALKIRANYRLVGRFMYDAVYDVGPQAFQDAKDRDEENITEFGHQYDLWEAYLDLSRGPLFFRIGRQNLAWGETDIFRLMDGINPLDNTFGGIFEDLDDRRIPLWMLRSSVNFGRLGLINSLSLEGFWVPGNWDARVGPYAPAGTPYAAPIPPPPFPLLLNTPSKVMSNSRWGARLMGVLGTANISIGHYKTFLDNPSSILNVEDTGTLVPNTWLELFWDDVQVTGVSLSFWEAMTDVIVRSEVAMFWDEAVFLPEVNTPLVPLPFPIPGIPGLPAQGDKAEKDILRFMVGLDKNLWIRKLNPTQTFLISLQYFGQYIVDYDDRIRQPVPLYPDATHYPGVKEIESTITMIMNTSYMSGLLTPQLVLAYDVRGAWMIQPSVNYIFEPFRFTIQYSAIEGAFTGPGVFQDRDQLSFIVSYLLN